MLLSSMLSSNSLSMLLSYLSSSNCPSCCCPCPCPNPSPCCHLPPPRPAPPPPQVRVICSLPNHFPLALLLITPDKITPAVAFCSARLDYTKTRLHPLLPSPGHRLQRFFLCTSSSLLPTKNYRSKKCRNPYLNADKSRSEFAFVPFTPAWLNTRNILIN